MDVNDVEKLLKAMLERDAADFNFEAMMAAATKKLESKQLPGPLADLSNEFITIVADTLRMVAPVIFEAGYLAGATAGMEISQEIRR